VVAVKIENDEGGELATIICFDPVFAQSHLLLGHKWVFGDDTEQFPYVLLPDTHDLVKRIREEGWEVDTSDYTPPNLPPLVCHRCNTQVDEEDWPKEGVHLGCAAMPRVSDIDLMGMVTAVDGIKKQCPPHLWRWFDDVEKALWELVSKRKYPT
jgi:hypothetical protein